MLQKKCNFIPIGYPIGFDVSTGEYVIERIGGDNVQITLEAFLLWSSTFADAFELDTSKDVIMLSLIENEIIIPYLSHDDLYHKIKLLNITRNGIGWQQDGKICIVNEKEYFLSNSLQYSIWQKANGRLKVESVFNSKFADVSKKDNSFKRRFTSSIIFLVKLGVVRLR